LRRIFLLFGLLALLALGVAACGGSSDSTASDEPSAAATTEEAEHENATPEEAREELAEIRTILADAVEQYKAGEAEAAEQAVGDAYLEHYEEVEGPLGDRNHDLMEELEEQISTDLRQAMKDGKSDEEIDALLAEITTNLDKAVEELA
jgi:hypothetical protein